MAFLFSKNAIIVIAIKWRCVLQQVNLLFVTIFLLKYIIKSNLFFSKTMMKNRCTASARILA